MRFVWLMMIVGVLHSAHAFSFADFLKQQEDEFNSYKDELDKEFGAFLKGEWEEYKQQNAPGKLKPKPKVLKPIDTTNMVKPTPVVVPKPQKVAQPKKTEPEKVAAPQVSKPEKIEPKAPKPIAKVPAPTQETKPIKRDETPTIIAKEEPIEKEKIPKSVPVVHIAPKPKPQEPPKKVEVPKPKVTSKTARIKEKKLSFYGQVVTVRYDNPLSNQFGGTIDSKNIANAWEKLASSEYVELVDQLKKINTALNLNDWGRLKLLQKVGDAVFRNANETRLFVWFAMTKMGYEMKVAYAPKDIILLAPTNTGLYSTTYYTIKGKRYYAIDFTNGKKAQGSVKSYSASHPKGVKTFDLTLDLAPNIKELKAQRSINFEYEGTKYAFDIAYDKAQVAYYNGYPQIEYEEYFKTSPSNIAMQSLTKELSAIIEGKSEVDAINIIMRMVQKGFEYKIDEEQFGYEKVMLVDETLYYKYSDCEDRAILFARLVRELMGLEVLGIKYPQHIATAVALKTPLNNAKSFKLKGVRYYMADPTYINSTVGMVAPQFSKQSFTTIQVQ